jgi:hypothetical protein
MHIDIAVGVLNDASSGRCLAQPVNTCGSVLAKELLDKTKLVKIAKSVP